MIRRSSAEVTGVRVDRLKAVGGKTGGGEPPVSFRMLNTLAVSGNSSTSLYKSHIGLRNNVCNILKPTCYIVFILTSLPLSSSQ